MSTKHELVVENDVLKMEIQQLRGTVRNSQSLASVYLQRQEELEQDVVNNRSLIAAWRKTAQDLMDENVELKRSKLHIPIEITHGSNPRG